MNDVLDGITLIYKIFADHTSLFSKKLNVNEFTKKLSFEQALQQKIQFNPDSNKQANEVEFSQKLKDHFYPLFTFNNNDIKKCLHQKHLGIILDSKLDFNIHVDSKIKKCYKTIGLVERLPAMFQEKLYLPSVNPSSNHIWTMEIPYMINQNIKTFKMNQKKFNIKHILR